MKHDEKLIRGIQACGMVTTCSAQAQHLITYPEAERILAYVREHDDKQNESKQDNEGASKA